MARGIRRIALAVLVIAAVIMGLAGIRKATAGPAVCSPCHEMAPRIESWRASAHSRVACAECHAGPHDWYELPQALGSQLLLLGRDVVAHVSRDTDAPVDSRPKGHGPMPDRVCLHCHHLGRQITPRQGILIDHSEHAARNGSCISCHDRTGHPLLSRGRELTFMSQCFTCHGEPEMPKASATCTVCHPKSFEWRPVSHLEGEWRPKHGGVALDDRAQCAMCHEQSFCDECHGLTMPHPDSWKTDERAGHAAYRGEGQTLCARCHEGGVLLCTSCHHENLRPSKGTWLEQHPDRVEQGGSGRCLSCHSPVDCTECHAKRARR